MDLADLVDKIRAVHLSPVLIAALLICYGCLGAAMREFLRRSRCLRGYKKIADDIRSLCKLLEGEISSAGEDVVVSGRYRGWPVVVRFSNADKTPGMTVRIYAPVCFSLFIQHKSMHRRDGRIPIRTGNLAFDQYFTTYSDDPAEAMQFLCEGKNLAHIITLCQSSLTLLSFRSGSIELAEFSTAADSARTFPAHLNELPELAEAAKRMPGAFLVTVDPPQPKPKMVLRISGALAIAALFCVLSWTGLGATWSPPTPPQDEVQKSNGISRADLARIPVPGNWRAARTEDFRADFLAWLDRSRQEPAARIEFDFVGTGTPNDVAYFLVGTDSSRRVVVLSKDRLLYDSRFLTLAGIARIPAQVITSITWLDSYKPTALMHGDGLLLAGEPSRPSDTHILFMDGERIASAIPDNYRQVRVKIDFVQSPIQR